MSLFSTMGANACVDCCTFSLVSQLHSIVLTHTPWLHVLHVISLLWLCSTNDAGYLKHECPYFESG